MPTLGLIIQWGSDGWTGGPNYLKNLALAVSSVPEEHGLKLVFFVRPDQLDYLEQYKHVLPLAYDIRVFNQDSKMDDIDLFYPFTGDIKIPEESAKAYWIPDFQHNHLPELFSKEDFNWRQKYFARLAYGTDMVVLSSQAALDDFKNFFDVRCPTHILRFVTSSEPGWFSGDPEKVKLAYGISSDYLMCCNQFWMHKDHKTLFKALSFLHERGLKIKLICTGAMEDSRHPDYFDSLRDFVQQEGLTEHVLFLGLIPREDQIQLLRGALAVVQPSLFEGWSTVIEDCRLLGKAVFYSDIPVQLEQNPPHSFSFRAGDPEDLARVLQQEVGSLLSTANTSKEQGAIGISAEGGLRFGLEIKKMIAAAVSSKTFRKNDFKIGGRIVSTPANDSNDVTGRNSYKVKGTQWYDLPLAGASTLASPLFDEDTYSRTLDILKTLEPDDYLIYLKGFMASGMRRFGKNWKFADICTVLHVLSLQLGVKDYLEIGVRQGRSMAMVVSSCPQVHIAAFDMWCADYAGMENPGPEFVRRQMVDIGHTGTLNFIDGNSQETLPAYFVANPGKTFDLITVDGDHTPEGAAQDIEAVLPHLRIGGAIVFDDIAHPAHPELLEVWHKYVTSRPEMSSFEFTELGYGVGFAVRMR